MKRLILIYTVLIMAGCTSSTKNPVQEVDSSDTTSFDATAIVKTETSTDSITNTSTEEFSFRAAYGYKPNIITFNPFINIDWPSLIANNNRLKSTNNPNGIDSTKIPCGGDFGFPVDYFNNVPNTHKTNSSYYLISTKGIFPLIVDSLQACISYLCTGDYYEEKGWERYFSGKFNYSGKFIGQYNSDSTHNTTGFVLKTDASNSTVNNYPIQSMLINDSVLFTSSIVEGYYEALDKLTKQPTGKYKCTLIDSKNRKYSFSQSRYLKAKLEQSYIFELNDTSLYLFTAWTDDEALCEHSYQIYEVKKDTTLLISSNQYDCDI